ncbi:hypothetical protein CIG19_06560 [Enterobacterales bacterium CwR94]|nr:hypothetical protein CIG19_06560 [Enterobacterales bacterium CwR94]
MPAMKQGEKGFSLVETLFALMLFAMVVAFLLRSQIAVGYSLQLQWQQRAAWRYAAMGLDGMHEIPVGWQLNRTTQPAGEGCQWQQIVVVSPGGRQARLKRFGCE